MSALRPSPSAPRRTTLRSLLWASSVALLLSCGGGGGGTEPGFDPGFVFTGFTGDLDWAAGGGIGGGADGGGGVGVGGDFGQFRNTLVVVRFPDGRELGRAPTDSVKGMVTIRPGSNYEGALFLELQGGAGATYFEEGKGTFVPFPAGQVIRVWVPRIDKNIGITPFTDAAYRLLTEGSTGERAAAAVPTPAEITAANDKVRGVLNQQFPDTLAVDDITRLPFIKSPSIGAGTIGIDPRGRYGLVNGAFSKQAAMFNASEPTPTLAALRQLGEDLLDGKLDGMRDAQPAVAAEQRSYDPHTLTGELSSALAEQSFRFGNDQSKLALPKVLNFGNTRYEGYLFDASLRADGKAFDTVAGWVGEDTKNFGLGKALEKLPNVARTFGVFANHGHGSVFFKTIQPVNEDNSQSKVFAVGDNVNGELGLGTTTSTGGAAVEVPVPNGLTLTQIAGGFGHTVARFADGSVYAWGDNSYGQLGQGLDAAALPRSLTPLKVNLPAGAVGVAATSTASYALLSDGRVFSWGDSLGFGLLGDGVKDSARTSPGPVMAAGGPLGDVVQISARDNDAVAVRRDGSILTWGSFPADPTAFAPSDLTTPYAGGSPLATPVAGIPAGTEIRKVLTEQGLFVALTTDGAVYTWGVHFEIIANGILRDLAAMRVRSLPRVRDLMPGGFIGYGQRPFDRLTAMAVGYNGNLFKVRGRVAEQFDPDKPTQQRRPTHFSSPPQQCDGCHVVLRDWPLTPPAPTTNAVCVPPPIIQDLIHADTTCHLCHNPEGAKQSPKLDYLTCVIPSNLPARPTSTTPPANLESCSIPTGHAFTPPGTTCASCHNSIAARPLQQIPGPTAGKFCGQPPSSELPSIRTAATITSAVNRQNAPIPNGASTPETTPTLQGTIGGALTAGQSVAVRRNGSTIGSASVAGTSWSLTDPGAGNGAQVYTARVEAGSAFGPTSGGYTIIVDTVNPSVSANVTTISDDISGNVTGGASSDTTPTVSGVVSGALATGEFVQVVRNGAAASNVAANGTSWTFTEPSALAAGNYSYAARVVDAAGNLGALGTAQGVTISTAFPLAGAATTITSVNGAALNGAASVALNNDGTPTLAGTIQRALSSAPAEVIRIYRNSVAVASIGTTAPGGTAWTFTTSPALASATYTFLARIEQSGNSGTFGQASASIADPIDVTAPTQTVTVSATTDVVPYNNTSSATSGSLIPGQTNDPSPTVRFQLSAPLGSGESLAITRKVGAGSTVAITPGLGNCGTDCLQFTDAPGVSIPVPSATPSASLPINVQYGARVVDTAGNQGPAASTLSFNFDYFTCDQTRANDAVGGTHTTISFSAAPATDCSSCHQATTPATPGGSGTPQSTLVPVPRTTPTYWCRRPG